MFMNFDRESTSINSPRVRHPRREQSGFVLIVTLIMVALAAITVISLLTNASLDRVTAKSYDDRFGAELAVQNGLEAAKKMLIATPDPAGSITADDTFLVLRAEGTQTNATGTKDAYYFLAKAQPGAANKIDCYPLFAGGTSSQLTINLAANPAVQKPQAPAAKFSNPAEQTFGTTTKQFPQLLPFQQPVFTQWQEVRDPNDPATAPAHSLPYQRYTFWVEDLSGYVDASVAGNETAGGKHQRVNGTDPNELALFTIFDTASQSDPGNTLAKPLIDNRPLLLTLPMLKQIAPTPAGQSDSTQANLGVRLGVDSGEQNLVPFGYGYPAAVEGKPKTDLNAAIKAKDVTGIAAAINTALPNFKNRAGGNTFDYNKNLAANIIDYADANKAPTTDGSTYRGIGAFPFLVTAYDLNNWVGITGGPPSDYQVQIEVTTYLQLWNPHNIAVKGDLTLHYENVDQLLVNTNAVSYAPPPDDVLAGFQMQPNEYKVIVFPAQTYTFDWGPTPPATSGPASSQSSIPFPAQTTANTVRLYWNGGAKLVDQPNKGLQRDRAPTGMRYNPNRNATNAVWRGNAAPPIYPATGGLGDPRISYYGNRTWTPADYAQNSAWGGRLQLGRPTVFAEILPSTWPDGGHDSTPGTKATGASVKPDALAAMTAIVPADADKWVSRLSTKGSLETMGELGNIFDLGEWNYAVPSANATTSLPDIPSSAKADTSLGSGGGFTLCVGRPEFAIFDTNGQRAWQLLDIFALSPRTVTIGLVNLNTASFEALRALAAGILHARDPAIQPAALATTLYPPTANKPTASENSSRGAGAQADLFAEAVIQSRPFLSTAQLQTAQVALPSTTTPLVPFFGNPNQWKDATPPTEWNDSGREELYSRLCNLTTVRSRNFRVFITGQSLDKNGAVLSTVNKVFQVFVNPTRSAAGAVQTQHVEVKYEAIL